VAEALRNGASLAAPVFGGRRGHPVGFARDWFEALAGLEGDRGARDVLAAHAAALALVPCDDPGILVDVDVPSHLEDLPTRLLRTPTPPAGAPAFLNPLLGAKS
jgi:molybdenum cofactor cytidylyltransferase